MRSILGGGVTLKADAKATRHRRDVLDQLLVTDGPSISSSSESSIASMK